MSVSIIQPCWNGAIPYLKKSWIAKSKTIHESCTSQSNTTPKAECWIVRTTWVMSFGFLIQDFLRYGIGIPIWCSNKRIFTSRRQKNSQIQHQGKKNKFVVVLDWSIRNGCFELINMICLIPGMSANITKYGMVFLLLNILEWSFLIIETQANF